MAALPDAKIRSRDMPILDKVFDMESGYVLNLSNQTFAAFFLEELDVDITAPRWAAQGTSKAKRLRYYLRQVDCRRALQTLDALWEYREATSVTESYPELPDSLRAAYFQIIQRLGGTPREREATVTAERERLVDPTATAALANRFLEVSTKDPQARGYAFEAFLKDVFDVYGMSARASFRLEGEQIDGSFMLNHQIYLLEARWRNARVDAADLHAFNGKVQAKARWSRGLIISQSGFTETGLHAFGSGKSVICMDGLDLHQVLSDGVHLAEVIAQKARRAAETGKAFVRVHDLNLSIQG